MATQRTESNPVEAASKPAVLLSSATEKLFEEKAESKVRPQDKKTNMGKHHTVAVALCILFLEEKKAKKPLSADRPVAIAIAY